VVDGALPISWLLSLVLRDVGGDEAKRDVCGLRKTRRTSGSGANLKVHFKLPR